MIPILAEDGRYRARRDELPLSGRPATSPQGAVVVVGGEGWWDAAIAAFERGALGVVVTRPREVDLGAVRTIQTVADGRPVIVERVGLRADAAARVSLQGAVAITAECRASGSELGAVVRDAVGWMRSIGGVALEVVRCDASGGAVVAELAAAGAGAPFVASLVAGSSVGVAPWLRVVSIGATRTEVAVMPGVDGTRTSIAGEDGVLVQPRLYEAPERVALRRAIDAVRAGWVPGDLGELVLDEQCVRALSI